MRNLIIITTISLFLAQPVALAGDEDQPKDDEGMQEMSMQDKMNKGMMSGDGMQKRMKKMRETMQQIHNTEDPDERRKLMQEHMRQMHEAMGQMQGMSQHRKEMHQKMKEMDGERCQKMMKMHSKMHQGMMQQMEAHMKAHENHKEN
ncbi:MULTISPECIES: hypothetical protein [unclassified Wenzhouxiangella]|uniref:hypothetical protein n=1 Tax=unclassified Wenzhouxiangella TaxID=2613841 RepID=UPI000E32845D|nr:MULTISPECIES: hypothetical protein [unclassified Wenzhouxiangella]RFF28036.1 hypothetical protein DZK25_05065 [Wenzhouxiangella sp. 15181]RFP68622.1 hypothetical protein DZK26_08070 [Wenzhouxiangella sp. 15190]